MSGSPELGAAKCCLVIHDMLSLIPLVVVVLSSSSKDD